MGARRSKDKSATMQEKHRGAILRRASAARPCHRHLVQHRGREMAALGRPEQPTRHLLEPVPQLLRVFDLRKKSLFAKPQRQIEKRTAQAHPRLASITSQIIAATLMPSKRSSS